MNKAEKARLEQAESALAAAKALSWPSYPKPEPRDVDAVLKDTGNALCVGWFQNNYGTEWRPTEGCSNRVHHSTSRTDRTTTHGQGCQYASRREALMVVRHEMTERFAAVLARIDAEIAKEA